MLGRRNHGIPRLAVPQLGFGEALHGVNVKSCLPSGNCSTSFPAALGSSASFNRSLFRDIGGAIGREARAQMLARTGRLPDLLVAAIGGGSNAIGLFHPFLDDAEVKMLGVEAAGEGLDKRHAASLAGGQDVGGHGLPLVDEAREHVAVWYTADVAFEVVGVVA